MSKLMSFEEFRKRFEVANDDNLTAREPHKYFDPFTERD